MKIKLFIFPIVFCMACNKTSVPKDVLPVEKMTEVVWDAMLADGLASSRFPTDSAKRFDTSIVMYKQVVTAHNITQEDFKRSMAFYKSRPDLMQRIWDTLQRRAIMPLPSSKKDTATAPPHG